MPQLESPALDQLFDVILGLETREECYRFFEDLCTVKELQDLSQRMEVALLLSRGENYITIGQKAGVSTATISRVSRCLNYGTGGYRNAIEKLEDK